MPRSENKAFVNVCVFLMYDAFQSILNDLFLRECNLHVQYVFLVKKDVISGTFLLVKIYKE